jgi:tRNA pseudouridine synthase 10
MQILPKLGASVLSALKQYQFQTFVVGCSVSPEIIDREDELRARRHIAGRQNIKGQISRYVGRLITSRTRRKVDHSKPDITVLLSIPSGPTTVSSRSIWISAFYRKTRRGIAQRTSFCRVCSGIGCAVCNYKGRNSETIQSLVTSFFVDNLKAEGGSFIWVGNEDDQSLVGGKGRPIYVEILKPKLRPSARSKRQIPNRLALGGIILNSIQILQSKPSEIPRLEMRCKIYLKPKVGPEIETELEGIRSELTKEFADRSVQIKLSKRGKSVRRRVQFVSLNWTDEADQGKRARSCTLELIGESGVPVRKLISGNDDEIVPNMSRILKDFVMDPLRPFDIVEINPRPVSKAFKSFQKSLAIEATG